ncbi:hypothetical protein CBL_04770 [Carabus blaptoides fortunei]
MAKTQRIYPMRVRRSTSLMLIGLYTNCGWHAEYTCECTLLRPKPIRSYTDIHSLLMSAHLCVRRGICWSLQANRNVMTGREENLKYFTHKIFEYGLNPYDTKPSTDIFAQLSFVVSRREWNSFLLDNSGSLMR